LEDHRGGRGSVGSAPLTGAPASCTLPAARLTSSPHDVPPPDGRKRYVRFVARSAHSDLLQLIVVILLQSGKGGGLAGGAFGGTAQTVFGGGARPTSSRGPR
jgi:hypothetical protein